MRILVFSDSHLSLKFYPYKYEFLKKIISQADQVIINGDFWEGFEITFDEFLSSKWSKLFPLLKSKNTVYIYGNHDEKSLSDERRSIFSTTQTESYTLPLGDKKLIFKHGHQYIPMKVPILDSLNKKAMNMFANMLEKITVRTGTFKYFLPLFKRMNNKIKHLVRDSLNANEILICGHTHCQEIDYPNNFINTGFMKHGLAQYMVIESGKLQFKEEWYH